MARSRGPECWDHDKKVASPLPEKVTIPGAFRRNRTETLAGSENRYRKGVYLADRPARFPRLPGCQILVQNLLLISLSGKSVSFVDCPCIDL
jgi:hypothetical protein